jgi:4-aminobutyrate aminotransferase
MLKKACERHGALFLTDEVQAGAGRSGKMWAIEHSGVVPDMLTWGKGMGGDMPMAGVTFRADLAEKVPEASQPNTFAGNAVSAVACMTNIDLLTENDNALINRTGRLGKEIKERLLEGSKDTRIIGDVRGRGLMIGIELVKDKETKEPLDEETMGKVIFGMLNRGVIMVPCGRYGNVLRFMPSLTITRDYCKKTSDIFLDVVKDI